MLTCTITTDMREGTVECKMHLCYISATVSVGTPASDASQAEGMFTGEQPKLAFCHRGLAHHTLQTDAAFDVLTELDGSQAIMAVLALLYVALPVVCIVRVQGMTVTYLHTKAACKISQEGLHLCLAFANSRWGGSLRYKQSHTGY